MAEQPELRRELSKSTWIWLILVALTLAAFLVAAFGWHGLGIVSVLLLTTWVKGQLIIDYFMELRHCSWRWRGVLAGYLAFVLGLIALAYGISQ